MPLFVISGVPASGKTTVSRLLAGRLDRAVCVPGDAIRAMVVTGRADMRPDAGANSNKRGARKARGQASPHGAAPGDDT